MLAMTPTTELEAVNIILENDGESPVASLDENGFDDVARAQSTLREIAKTVQTSGWAFNTDYNRKFTPDAVTKHIELPQDAVTVTPTYWSMGRQVIERGRKLYDLENNTYEFTTPIYLDVVTLLDFEELPEYARYYITIRAARVYQSRGTGSPRQDSFTRDDERNAQADMKKADMRMKRRGFFRNPYNAAVLVRRPL